MKILIATGLYPPEIGGPATYTAMLEQYLPSRGIEVSVLPFSVVRHLPKIIRHVAYLIECLLLAHNVDVIFAQDPVSVGLPAMLVAKILKKHFFLRLGGDYAWEQGRLRFGVTDPLEVFVRGKMRYHPVVRLLKRIQKYVALRALRVTVQSEFMKRIVICWGIPEEKVVVIPNGFSYEGVLLDHVEARKMLNAQGTVAVSAGRLVPWKGFAALIEVVPEIAKRVPDFVLYIIGDGPDAEKLRRIVAEQRLTERVFFTGRLNKKTLMRYLRAADVFVLNTEYEGFSNQLLEAYTAETPVVTTDIGGNQGVVARDVSGLLVPPHDKEALKRAIIEVLENKTLANKLVAGGREKLKEFSIELVITATKAFLA